MSLKNAQEEMLELAMFDAAERKELLPRWRAAAKELGLTDEVVHNAVHNHLPRLKDLKYEGVRKSIGAVLRELMDLFRFKEDKANGADIRAIYGVLPAILTPYQALKYAGGDKVYTSFPDMILMKNMQEIFHHAWPLFAKAEEAGFSYGARHCALNKMGIAGRLTGIVPHPDVMWSWGLVCDEATKVDEFLKNLTGGQWTSVYTRYPHDTYFDEEDYLLPDRIAYLGDNMRRAMKVAERVLGVHVTDEHTAKAVGDFRRYMGKVGGLSRLNMHADPVPVRNSTLSIFYLAASIPFNTGLAYLEDAIDTLTAEVKQAIEKGEGIAPKGAARAGMYFNPSQNAWFDALLIENGVVVTFSLPSTQSKAQMTPSTLTDPFEQMAEQWLKMNFGMGCGADTRNWVEKVEMANPDAMIVGFLDYDRWLGQVQKSGAKIVEEATGVPTFYVEADFYDDRDYSEEALRTRIESIAQIIKMKKAAKAAANA